MKQIIIIALLLPHVYACTKSTSDTKEIIDHPTYSYLTELVETAVKTETGDWQPITDGKRILLFSNDSALVPTAKGEFKTTGTMKHPMVAGEGYFSCENGALILSSKNKTTIDFAYAFLGDTAIVLTNRSVTPTVEVRFRVSK